MLKDFLAAYGVIRLIEDASKPKPPPDDNNNDEDNGCLYCGCLVIMAIAVVLCLIYT
ncbi:MAG: hypothetical protein IKD29_08795 [Lentisphaeria bacterium]|nr:hypothetical protein [Lentisphaeria bacterium]